MARPAVLASILLDIFKKHHLLSVSDLLQLVEQQDGKKYNKTSIYRALEKLEQQEHICQHVFGTDENKYELRHNHHDHLVCSSCGRIQSSDCSITIPDQIEGFQTNHYHLTIFGLCQDCQNK